MKRPGDKTPEPPGGRAAQRLQMYEQARGTTSPCLVYRSDTAGSTWVNCTAGLPNIPMNSVVVDPANFKRIFVSADVGVYQSTNQGSSWASFSSGLPNAMAVDLILHKKDRVLICATRNRGAWVIAVP